MWLKNDNYKDYLKGLTVVEVSGESCANCLTLMPILDRLVGHREDVKLHHIEAAEDTMELIEKFEIQAVPTILVLYDEEIKARCKGFQPEEILELWLDAKIADVKKEYNL
ncbi:MAG: thioredoxin family protein [Acholeplasmatales bacterium]|nr:thioredoxin family protein [Acholeplasmatales bacterium]